MNIFRLLLATILIQTAISAQQVDNPVRIPVSYYGESFGTTTGGRFQFGQELGTETQTNTISSAYYNTVPGAYFYSNVATAYLEIGKDYQVNVTSSQVPYVNVHFSSVNGTSVFINGKVSKLIGQGQGQSTAINYSFTLRVEANTDWSHSLSEQRGGACTSFPDDKAMWLIGLGKLRNGDYAGAIGIRSGNVSYSAPNHTNPSSLTYSLPDNTGDVVVARDAFNVIKSIRARDVAIVVDPYDNTNQSTTSYSIKCYSVSDFDANSLANPFIVYTIKRYTVGGVTGLQIDKTEDGIISSTIIFQDAAKTKWTKYDWRLNPGGGTPVLDNPIITTASGMSSTTTYGSAEAPNPQLTKVKNFVTVNGQRELASMKMGSAAVGTSITYDYYADNSGSGWTGAVKSMIEPSGSWVKYDYFNSTNDARDGLKKVVYKPFASSPATPDLATLTNCYVETYEYTTGPDQSPTMQQSKIVTINGQAAGKTTWSYNWAAGSVSGHAFTTVTENDYSSAANYITTTTAQFSDSDPTPFFRGRSHYVSYPNKTKSSFAYFSGTWAAGVFSCGTAGKDFLSLEFHGNTDASFGGNSISQWTWTEGTAQTWTMAPIYLIPNLSTIDATCIDTKGHVVFTGKYIYTSSGTIELISGIERSFDSHGQLQKEKDLVRSVAGAGGEYSTSYNFEAGLLKSVVDPHGNMTSYGYDGLLRKTSTVLAASSTTTSAYPKRELSTTYYSSNLVATQDDENLVRTTFVYRDDGRIDYTSVPQPGGGSITTSYAYPTARKVVKTVKGDGNSTGADFGIEKYLDGRTFAVTGSGQANKYFNYSSTTGNVVEYAGDGIAAGNGWIETTKDWLGRKIKERRPWWGYSSTNNTRVLLKRFTYDTSTAGALTKVETLDESQANARVAPDHIFQYGSLGSLLKEGDDLNNNGSLEAVSTDVITLYSRTFYKDPAYNGWIQNDVVKKYGDVAAGAAPEITVSNKSTRLTSFNNGSLYGGGRVIRDEVLIDASGRYSVIWEWSDSNARTLTKIEQLQGVSNTKISVWTDKYLSSEGSFTGNVTNYIYNSQGLESEVTTSATSGDTLVTYWPSTKFVKERKMLSGVRGSTNTYYTQAYEYSWSADTTVITTTDASGAFICNRYNAAGQVINTWGNGASPIKFTYDTLGRKKSSTTYRDASLFQTKTWPASEPVGDTTGYAVDPTTGLLNTRTYPNSTTNSYTYKPLGQLATSTNARAQVVTYNYFDSGSNQSGLRSGVSYDGGQTNVVSYTYTRDGMPLTVSDSTGTRTFKYRADGQADYEDMPIGWFGGASSSRLTTNYGDANFPGVPTGISFSGNSQTFWESFTFDSAGRIGSVNATGFSLPLAVDYIPGTSILKSIGIATGFTREVSLAPYTGAIQSVYTSHAGSRRATFSQYFDTDRQVAICSSHGSLLDHSVSGWSAYLGLGQGYTIGNVSPQSSQKITYNTREMISSIPSFGWLGIAGAAGEDSKRISGWTFDGSGNRLSETGAKASTYMLTDSPSNGAYGSLNQYSSVTGSKAESSLKYDADGNLTSDSTWTYTYDPENRLQTMTSVDRTFEFSYDYLGRRVWKRFKEFGVIVSNERYLWNGMQVVATFDLGSGNQATPVLSKQFVYGPDLSDQRASAAGAGSLIAEIKGGSLYFAIVDTYGSSMGYMNSMGNIVAARDYDCFGQTFASLGDQASFPIGFAGKIADSYSPSVGVWNGLVYYGFRYYDPKHGRFINRDPIAESGGYNLYAWCGNSCFSHHDKDGLADSSSNDDPPPGDTTILYGPPVYNDYTSWRDYGLGDYANAFGWGVNQGIWIYPFGYQNGLGRFGGDGSELRVKYQQQITKAREGLEVNHKTAIRVIKFLESIGVLSKTEAAITTSDLFTDELVRVAGDSMKISASGGGENKWTESYLGRLDAPYFFARGSPNFAAGPYGSPFITGNEGSRAVGAVLSGGAILAPGALLEGFSAAGIPSFFSGYSAIQAQVAARLVGGYTLLGTPIGYALNRIIPNMKGLDGLWSSISGVYSSVSAITSRSAYFLSSTGYQGAIWLQTEQPLLEKAGVYVINPVTGMPVLVDPTINPPIL